MTTFGISPDRPLKYTGSPLALVPTVKAARAPLVTDKNWPVMTFWNDDSTSDIYCLTHFDSGDAIWELFISSATSSVQTLTSDSGVATAVSNNINTLGTAAQGLSSSASGSTVTWTIADATDTQKGVASFDATDFIVTNGAVTLASTPTAIDYITDSGTATETGGELNVLGGTNIASTGSGNTITLNFDGVLPVASGGTNLSSYTIGDILYASGATTLTKLGIGASGEVLTVAAGIPDWVAKTPLTITTDSGTATESSNNFNIVGAGGATVSGSGSTVTVDISGVTNNLLINDFEKTIVAACDFFTISDGYSDTGGNASTSFTLSDVSDHPGVARNRSTSAVYRAITLGTNYEENITVGQGILTMETWYRLEGAYSSGLVFYGLQNVSGSTPLSGNTDAIGFLIANAGSSTEWAAITRNTSTTTTTLTGTNISTSWQKLAIVVNADATSVGFYIDNSLVATHITNIPATSTKMFYQFGVQNNGGNYIYHDFMQLIYELNGARA